MQRAIIKKSYWNIPLGLCSIDTNGIWFECMGDGLCWKWPWKRVNGHTHYSVNFQREFTARAEYGSFRYRFMRARNQLKAAAALKHGKRRSKFTNN